MNRVAVAVPGRTAGALDALWRFSRPHTVIGTTVSIVCLYLIAVDTLPGLSLGGGLWDLFWTLVAGLAVNVYIVGVNQLEDVEIDRVNKPFLPLAAGDMTHEQARTIVAACAGLAVVLAVTQGLEETVAVLVGLVVGTAYSTPPLRLKRFPALASLSISGVRSIVVNLGVYAHFSLAFGDTISIPAPVWALTLVVIPFSFAIAILKDVPDAEGDRRYRIMTFTVRRGGRAVHACGDRGAGARLPGDGDPRAGLPRHGVGRSCSPAGNWPRWRCSWCGPAASTPPTRRASRASTCASGSCSSSSTCWSRSPAWRASAACAGSGRRSARRSRPRA